MHQYLSEFLGSAILIIFGNGVVANVILNKTKGNGGGWIVITFGWAIAVFVAVFAATQMGGKAHLNPAITIAFAVAGKFDWASVPYYILSQVAGCMMGALFVFLSYFRHISATDEASTKLAIFSTIPAIRDPFWNFVTEGIASLVFVLAVFFLAAPTSSLGALDALPVALLVLGIGLSLGGPTGYAINPARDLGPRIMHTILPVGVNRKSDWGYAWIPIAAPITGGILAALIFGII